MRIKIHIMSVTKLSSDKLLSEYKEVLYWKITHNAGRVLLANLLALPLAVFWGMAFYAFVRVFGHSQDSSLEAAIIQNANLLLVGVLLVVILHELAHGIAMQIFGAQTKYGVIWKGLMFYATAPGYTFRRNQYLAITLAPLVSLSILACCGILIQAGTTYVWLWALWAMVNGGSAIGDLWITAIALRYPVCAYIIDEQDGIRVFLPNKEVENR
jgi:hypothetical protein